MKIISNNQLTTPIRSLQKAAELTGLSAKWRKELKVGDYAILAYIVVLDRICQKRIFDTICKYEHRKVQILELRNCGPCRFCSTSIGFVDLGTETTFTPKCLGLSIQNYDIHTIYPIEYFQSKMFLFNSEKGVQNDKEIS